MADKLRYYADLIDNDEVEPEIEAFMIAFKQGDSFTIGGTGVLYPKEKHTLKKQFIKFIAGLK